MRLLEGLGPSVLVFKVYCVRICSVEMLSKKWQQTLMYLVRYQHINLYD